MRGSQDEVGAALGAMLIRCGTTRLDDFGGVCETFLCEDGAYVSSPRRTKLGASILSFTPKNKLAAEAQEMARVARSAGYGVLVLTLQKHDKFGKVWILSGVLRHVKSEGLVYYEDTGSIVDELKASPEGSHVHAVHVLAPGYEDCPSRLADRVVSQSEYQREVLQGS